MEMLILEELFPKADLTKAAYSKIMFSAINSFLRKAYFLISFFTSFLNLSVAITL
jgi:hypothetical protein